MSTEHPPAVVLLGNTPQLGLGRELCGRSGPGHADPMEGQDHHGDPAEEQTDSGSGRAGVDRERLT